MSRFIGCNGFIVFALLVVSFSSAAQQPLPLRDFVVLGKESVQLGSSSNIINGGRIGSYQLIQSVGTATINSHVHSGGVVQLANSNTVVGDITAANAGNLPNPVLLSGSNASLTGAISVAGNISISGGTVSGPVKTSGTYTGPAPTSGTPLQNLSLASLNLPVLPPVITRYDLPELGTPTTPVNNTATITPGAYTDMTLTGSKTVTFKGTGSYVFNSISNSGNFNKFVFDFEGNTTGVFRIFVVGDVNLYKINIDYKNLSLPGGTTQNDLAARILMQVHGDGSTQGGHAWNITNGASGNNQSTWLGTVVTLNGNINIGSGSSLSKIIGCLLSEKNVFIQSGVSITYVPLLCNTPVADAGPDKTFTCPGETGVTIGTNNSKGAFYQWTTLVDGVSTVVGHAPTLFATTGGLYTLTVTNDCGVSVADAVSVTYVSCVEPLNETPGGKVDNIIGAELTNLTTNMDEAVKYLVISQNRDSVLIEAVAKIGFEIEARDTLWKYGLRDTIPNGINPLLVTGWFPVAQLLQLNEPGPASVLNHVRPVYQPLGNVGLVTSAGDTSIGTNLVRNGFNVGGEGIKIGVISDSYNTDNQASTDVLNGDLPGDGNPDGNTTPVEVVYDYPYGQRSNEGRAMLQIVHDLAPKSPLAFRTGFVSAGDFAYGILQLKDAGCNVIVDDVTYLTEPFFKDGIVSQAVEIATASGVTCFTSAGNFGTKSYSHVFRGTTLPGTTTVAHDFSGTGDVYQRLKLKNGSYTIVLQWQDDIYSLGTSATGTLNDLDIYLIDPSGRIGFNRNNIGGDPLEVLSFSINLPDTSMSVDADLMIVKGGSAAGALNPVFKYIIFRGNATIQEYYSEQALTDKSTIVGHANSANEVTVGAVLWSNTPPFGGEPTIASFSSTGGTPIYTGGTATVRRKPEVVAPNGVNTSRTVTMGPDNDGSGNADGFPNFFGTSASAPHAAAAAALIMEARKKFYDETPTPDALKYYLFNSARTMQPDGVVGGVNFKAGYGLIQPDLSIRSFANPTPYINDLVYDASITPGTVPFRLQISGEYLTSSSTIYFRGEQIETVVNESLDTLSGDIPEFTGNPPIYVVTPPLANGDGGESNTLYFFSAVKDTVTIIADNKVKLYGEELPALTTTILLNGDTLENYNTAHGTSITRADLGVDNLTIRYTNPDMNAMTGVGTYQIRASRTFDETNETDLGLLERYVYDSTFGNLQINKLAVTVQARDTTIEYGEALTNFHFNYIFDPAANLANPAAVEDSAVASHEEHMVNALALMNSSGSGDIVIFNGKLLNVFTMPSVTINGKLYPVVNGSGGTAVVLLNGEEIPVTNGSGGTAVILLNGQEIPVTNGTGGTAVVLLNGQIYPVLFNGSGDPYVHYNNSDYSVTNGSGGTAVILLNGQEIPVLNGSGGTAVVLLNHEYYAVVNGSGGTAVVLLNGQEYPVVNGSGGTAVILLNGEEYPVVNGSGGTAVVLLNGEVYPVVNGSGGTAVILLNGEEIPVVNGSGGTAVVLLNGQEYPVVNGSGGTAVILLNGEMHPVVNGSGGTAVVLLNGEQIPVLNGSGGTAVVLLNGEVYPVVNGSGGTAVILLNGEEIPVTNGTGGTAVVLLNGTEIPVVNSISKEALTNVSALASTNAIANFRMVNSTQVIDVSANAFVNFTVNSLQAPLVNARPLVNSRTMLNVAPIANGSGGTAVILLNNGNTVPVLNGSDAYVNSETIDSTTTTRTPVIIDEADVNSAGSSGATITMDGVNMITGLTAGEQYLVPATLLNPNFDIRYLPGKVTITKAPLQITANNASKVYGSTVTLTATGFTVTQGPLKYDEKIMLVSMQSEGSAATATAGNYPIIPSNALGAFGTDASNYNIHYIHGTLTVGTRTITVTADAKTKTYGTTDPPFTYQVTAGSLSNGDNFTGQLTRDPGENVGNYTIRRGTLSAGGSYSVTFVSNTLEIKKSMLLVTADDKTKTYGSPNPAFTASYSGFVNGDNQSAISGTPQFTTTADVNSLPGTYTIIVSSGTLTSTNYDFTFKNGKLTVADYTGCLITHSKFSSFGSTTKAKTALWVNIEIKVSGQLAEAGDYVMFSGGKINFYNISSSPEIIDYPMKRGIIIADASVLEPVTEFNVAKDMFITKVPVGFSSTSDIFIAGGVVTSTNGFTKKNNPSTVLEGIFYSNKAFSDQWMYGLAAYQTPNDYVKVTDLATPGSVVSINGNYKAGTPMPWLNYIASGGSGNGGNNYTGSSSSNDNFSSCSIATRTIVQKTSGETMRAALQTGKFLAFPNPAHSALTITYVPETSSQSTVALYSIHGAMVKQVYNGFAEQGKTYQMKLDVTGYPSGVYLLRLQQPESIVVQKIEVLRN